MANQINVCNMALAEIVAEPIESLNEASLAARECGRSYPHALQLLLESHEWGFATRRANLAPLINIRAGEWAAAYAMPIDMARAIKVVPASAIAGVGGWWVDDNIASVPYLIEDTTMFCSVDDAVFAYITSDVTAAALSAKFVDALVYELASRIVMPIKKSREMKGDLIKQAQTAKERAIADDMNRQPVLSSWTDQVQAVRDGGWGAAAARVIPTTNPMYSDAPVLAPVPTETEELWDNTEW